MGDRIGHYLSLLSLAWTSRNGDGLQLIRLHRMLVEARNFKSAIVNHPAFPGGKFIGPCVAMAVTMTDVHCGKFGPQVARLGNGTCFMPIGGFKSEQRAFHHK